MEYLLIIILVVGIVAYTLNYYESNQKAIKDKIKLEEFNKYKQYKINELETLYPNYAFLNLDIMLFKLNDIDDEKDLTYYLSCISNKADRYLQLLNKYVDIDIVTNLFIGTPILGMSPEMLIDSIGHPGKIETTKSTKDATETYVYGNKKSGNYYIFKDDKLIKYSIK